MKKKQEGHTHTPKSANPASSPVEGGGGWVCCVSPLVFFHGSCLSLKSKPAASTHIKKAPCFVGGLPAMSKPAASHGHSRRPLAARCRPCTGHRLRGGVGGCDPAGGAPGGVRRGGGLKEQGEKILRGKKITGSEICLGGTK